MSGRRLTLLVAGVAAALALGAGAAGRIYHGPLFTLLVTGAVVLPALIGLLLARRPQWSVAPVSVLAMLGYLMFAVWYSAGAAGVAGSVPALFLDAARNGGPRMLTALVPVEAQPDTVLLPLVFVWLATLISTELAVRGRRPSLALLPSIVVYLTALWLAGPHGGAEPWRAVAYVAAAAVTLAAGTDRSPGGAPIETHLPARRLGPLHTRMRLRAALGLGIFVAAATAVVPAVALGLPDSPIDPRAAVTPPQSDTLDEDPLARISGWMQNPSQKLFTTDTSAAGRMTLAVLSDFDGVTWKIGATYRQAGHELPEPSAAPAADPPAPGTRVTQRVTIQELSGRLVPAVTAPREIDGIRVDFDLGSGTVLREDGLRPGLAYTVTSEHSTVDANALATSDVPSGPSVARYLAVGSNVPTELQKFADSIATGNAGGYQKAYALQHFIAEHYTLVSDAPSGHAYPNLKFFLLGARAAGGQRGTSEQFAASFAALGRLMGLPTRVMVGFSVPAGPHTVVGADALAWPEVLFTGLGWVPFDPLPVAGTKARPVEQDYRPPPDPPTPTTQPPTQATQQPSRSASARPSLVAARHAGWSAPAWLPWAAGGTLVGLVLAAQVAVVLMRRRRTIRRLDTGEPSDRVRGAWLEVLDALRLTGRRPPGHLSATEVAEWATHPDGKSRALPPLTALAELANMVGFAPEWADDADAAAATAQTRAYVRALRAAQPWWRRPVMALRPGPLRWHHGDLPMPGATTPPPSDGVPLRRATPR